MSLQHCPFCGLTDRDTVSPDMGETPAIAMHQYPGPVFRVECEGCNTHGPLSRTGPEAEKAWNTRWSK